MEPKELSPDVADKNLAADFQNVVRKVAAGKPLNVAERARIESRAAGRAETMAYTKTLLRRLRFRGIDPCFRVNSSEKLLGKFVSASSDGSQVVDGVSVASIEQPDGGWAGMPSDGGSSIDFIGFCGSVDFPGCPEWPVSTGDFVRNPSEKPLFRLGWAHGFEIGPIKTVAPGIPSLA